MGKISRERGKRIELAIARYMGMQRSHFEAEDLHGHPLISIEVKHRESHPKTLVRQFAQAEAAASGTGKAPVLVLHESLQEYGNSYAVMRLKDLRDIVGTGEPGPISLKLDKELDELWDQAVEKKGGMEP